MVHKYEQLASLSDRFARQACHLAKIIISELNVSDKLIHTLSPGVSCADNGRAVRGLAGGIKFKMRCGECVFRRLLVWSLCWS